MKESTRTTLLVAARTAFAAVCVAVVVIVRPSVGWGGLAVMLAALGGLLVLLATYNRRFQ